MENYSIYPGLKRIQTNVEQGHDDINAYSSVTGTILHNGKLGKKAYTELVKWAVEKKFRLINHTDKDGVTPLMFAIKRFGGFKDDITDTYIRARADTNARDNNGNSVLFYALEHTNNVHFVRKLINKGKPNVNLVNNDGENAAHIVMKGVWNSERRVRVLELLLKKGFRGLGEKNRDGSTADQLARNKGIMDGALEAFFREHGCISKENEHGSGAEGTSESEERSNMEKFKLRMERGEQDINMYSSVGGTALHFAAENISQAHIWEEFARWAILEGGFHLINHVDNGCRTPLTYAIKEYGGKLDDETLRIFFRAGTDWPEVIAYAREHANDMQLVRRLERIQSESTAPDGSSGGATAPRSDLRRLKMDIAQGHVDVNAYSSEHGTILHNNDLDKSAYTELIKYAVEKDFRLINHGDKDGVTPLMFAVKRFGDLNDYYVDLFIRAGADMNVTDNNGNSVLFYALEHSNNVHFVRKLINKGQANVLLVNNDGDNAAHKVMTGVWDADKRVRVLRLLVAKGFRGLGEKNRDGLTAEQLARNEGKLDERLEAFLGGFWADKSPPSVSEARSIMEETKKLMIESSDEENINEYDNEMGTVLHGSATGLFHCKIWEEFARWAILDGGFQLIDHTDQYGRTPLMHAMREFGGELDDETLRVFFHAGAFWPAMIAYARELANDMVMVARLERIQSESRDGILPRDGTPTPSVSFEEVGQGVQTEGTLAGKGSPSESEDEAVDEGKTEEGNGLCLLM